MASEAVVLGTPALFIGDFDLGYLRLLRDAGLIQHQRNPAEDPVPAALALLRQERTVFLHQRQSLLAGMEDVGAYVAQVLRRLASGGRLSRDQPALARGDAAVR